MACTFDKNRVSKEELDEMKKKLEFVSEKTNTYMSNPYSKTKKKEKPIPMYFVQKNTVTFPLLAWSAFFNEIPNKNNLYSVTSIVFTGTLRENQVSVTEECLEQLTTYGTTIVGLYPGFGKTEIGGKLFSFFPYRVVVLVHREVLTTQWKKSFEDNTNAKVFIVPLSKEPVDIDPSYNVIICMVGRVKSMKQRDRDDMGFLIIDEAHAFCTPEHAPFLLWFHPQYVLVETATLMRDDGMEKVIYSISGTHGVYRDSKKPFIVYKVETGIKAKRFFTKQGKVNYSRLVSDTLLQDRRDAQLLPILEKEKGNKILVLTSLTEHVDILNNLFLEKGYNSDSYSGKKKSYIDKDILVGTISKIGTGFDPANACKTYDGRPFRVLILMCSIKKYALLVQVFGRIFRDDFPVVYYFVDADGIFENHWTNSSRWILLHEGKIINYKESKKMKNQKD